MSYYDFHFIYKKIEIQKCEINCITMYSNMLDSKVLLTTTLLT